jgi:hypothetical protein
MNSIKQTRIILTLELKMEVLQHPEMSKQQVDVGHSPHLATSGIRTITHNSEKIKY